LTNGLQAIEDLKTSSATTRVDSTKAKMVMTIVTHVDEGIRSIENKKFPTEANKKAKI
jgi:hypothetical protein